MIPKYLQLTYIEALKWGKIGCTWWCECEEIYFAYDPKKEPFKSGPMEGLFCILNKEEKEAYDEIVGKNSGG